MKVQEKFAEVNQKSDDIGIHIGVQLICDSTFELIMIYLSKWIKV